MKNKIQFYSFTFFIALFGCAEKNPSSIVGEALTATVQVPEEGVDLEYLWEFINLPDNSNISNSDIQAGDDNISIIFVPILINTPLLALSTECFATACAISCPITAARPFVFFVE